MIIIRTFIISMLLVGAGFSKAENPDNKIYLHCGELEANNIVNKDIFETPQIHIFFNNQSNNYFLVIDFDKKIMHRYPYKYSSDMSPLFDENERLSREIIPANSKILEKPGVAYISWISKSPITSFLDEYIYVASKTKIVEAEGFLGGILTTVETSMITSGPEPIPQVIKPSVVVTQHLCSRVFDFSVNNGE